MALEIETRQFLGAAVHHRCGRSRGVHGLRQSDVSMRFRKVCASSDEMETPPNELARAKMNQARAAATAGANAWKGLARPDTHSAAS